MKELKLNRTSVIVLGIIAAIAVAGAIAVAVMPNWYFDSNGDSEQGAVGKFVICLLLAIVAFVIAISVFVGYHQEKQKINTINKFRASLGDNALLFEGTEINSKEARETARENAASIAGGMIFAIIFGFGFFRIRHNSNARVFVVHDDGIYVINRQTMEKEIYGINAIKKLEIVLGKNGQVTIKLPSVEYYFSIQTKNTDVSAEWLQNRLKELSKKQIVNVTESPFDGI